VSQGYAAIRLGVCPSAASSLVATEAYSPKCVEGELSEVRTAPVSLTGRPNARTISVADTSTREIASVAGRNEVVQRRQFVVLVPTALMLGALIALVDSSLGWDDTGVSAAMVLTASGLVGTLHPQRMWALAVGSWIPLLGIVFGRFDYASLLGLAFALVGAYAGAFAGKRLTTANGTT
jgi:hypothetical protein